MLPRLPDARRTRTLAALLAAHLLQLLAYMSMLYDASMARAVPVPYHTSALSGQAWVDELYHSQHPDRILCELGVRRHIFNILISELRWMGYTESRHISLEEKLAIFLYTCVTGLSIRHVGERFQHSNETISIYFKEMLDAFSGPNFYNRYVHLPTATTPQPQHFANNPIFMPFFKDALGAIDGSHIPSWPSKEERQYHRDRKGQVSKTSFAAAPLICGSNMQLLDMMAQQPMQQYRAPVNAQELFNLRHAQARNVIERIFGVLKKRWACLCTPLKYNMTIQARVPSALIAIHNLILRYDPVEATDVLYNEDEDIWDPTPRNESAPDELSNQMAVPQAEQAEAEARRNAIAEAMWIQYQSYLNN
ncbi:Nuclease harbi1-like [Mycena indigotica]|uniref:Nuclease harbi1-like n=1 Tax=Mycena indigotica TaxID=2126181 RepID=A0A8H6T4K5_9AGAR|nr:Nuclease harbi1-like [Mycena indigotica]KAF7309310.1 Nuclease harbi1-like [Mycena indigotica]